MHADASEIYRLAGDLSQVGFRAVAPLREGMSAAGEAMAKEWRENVKDTLTARGEPGRSHAWAYPDSITSELVFDITGVSVDVGPDALRKQGFLGPALEFGGEHSPAYLHGLKALDGIQQRVERIIDAAIGPLL